MSAGIIWIIVGIFLILTELLATSVIAVFIGIGAITTGILLQLGVITSQSAQYLVFGGVSLATLLLARKHLQNWFVGFTSDTASSPQIFQKSLGDRVEVQSTFVHGRGRVVLNGVQWDASSEDPLEKGDVAWVIKNDGITLIVSRNQPAK
ncbi:peptidase [Aliidiomarina taiwanensis]|uniref:Peptidase n=1 Tax=Aliidiomarina taiwanensis TaxID=946228 RepID=A0A432X9U5_9GAMM|nr:NfeD family protein [Aliidiomarina taiwanensis]RUO44157.1 peptidase [Aliidiomarina taiwanensis]